MNLLSVLRGQWDIPPYATNELRACDATEAQAQSTLEAVAAHSQGGIAPSAQQWELYECLVQQAGLAGDSIWVVLIKAVLILVFLLTSVLFALWFERRLIARFQERVGPNVHGPFGLLQSVADAMKLLFKEDITVRAADKLMYVVAPFIAVVCAFIVFAVIPFGPATEIPWVGEVTPLQLTDFPVAVLFVLAATALGVYGIVLGGWASGSTYPLMGSIRSTAQVISYELAMGLSLVTVFMVAGSMSMSDAVDSQREAMWWFIPLAPAFVLYVISMIGETNRLPFDLPEAEGELVAGFMTEYSSMKFAWFFLAEYVNMINVSAVATVLFFGGWSPAWHSSWPGYEMLSSGIFPPLWLILKIWFFMGIFVWVRGTLLRLRYDQFMKFGWKVLIPFGLVWVAFFAISREVVEQLGMDVDTFVLFSGPIFAVVLIGVLVVLARTKPRVEPAAIPEGEIDAFADGYPVPPLPGQKLPPSPRSGATVDSRLSRKAGSDD